MAPPCEHKVAGPCDQLLYEVGVGHFVLGRGLDAIFTSPDTGYKLLARQRSNMLVDGKGQYGDIGYPMSIPSYRYRGEKIAHAVFDQESGQGQVRLDLLPAYPRELNILQYYRDFIISKGKHIICRDTVVFAEPHRISWLFQFNDDVNICEEAGLRFRLKNQSVFYIEPFAGELELAARVDKTPIVWSYASASGFQSYKHLRFDTVEPVKEACVDFMITWDDGEAIK